MSLYDLHSNPETLPYYNRRFEIPRLAYLEARKIYKETRRRSPSLEPFILKDIQDAYNYAFYVLEGRWLEAEPLIAQNIELSHHYVKDLLNRGIDILSLPQQILDGHELYKRQHPYFG